MYSTSSSREQLLDRIYHINEKDFDTVAIDVARYQFRYNDVYRTYCGLISRDPMNSSQVTDIPFLPVSLFRDQKIQTGNWEPETVFRSSGTTQTNRSTHLVKDVDWYNHNAKKAFAMQFGEPSMYNWIALLPSYMEKPNSSLIHMVNAFMGEAKDMQNHFFSQINHEVIHKLLALKNTYAKTILIGVSYALLDLFQSYDVPVWEELQVIETGGMKGRRKEMTRNELHTQIKNRAPSVRLYSEYGMTELLSQAYMIDEAFKPAATMKVIIRDMSDPMTIVPAGKRGCINVIDLANIDTCSFLSTDDIGIVNEDGSFEVLGRLDQSDIRGCNLLYA